MNYRCAWQFNFIQEISVIKNSDNLPLDVGVVSQVLVEGSGVLEGHFEVRRRFYNSRNWEQTLGHVWRRPREEVKRKTKVKEALSEKNFSSELLTWIITKPLQLVLTASVTSEKCVHCCWVSFKLLRCWYNKSCSICCWKIGQILIS